MASGNEIAEVKRGAAILADDPVYTTEEISALIDSSSVNKTLLRIWREKAAGYASLASMSEAGSSRSLGELHDNALEMIKLYERLVADEDADAGTTGARRPRSLPIERV